MATRRWSIGIGDNQTQITEAVGSATASKAIEVTVDFAVVTDVVGGKMAVVESLQDITNYILQGTWPPA